MSKGRDWPFACCGTSLRNVCIYLCSSSFAQARQHKAWCYFVRLGARSITIILMLMAPGIAVAQDVQQRRELGGLVTYTFLREIGSTDSGVGTQAAGLGARLVYRVLPVLDLETEINFLPGNSATS